jgi:hypothetical protein
MLSRHNDQLIYAMQVDEAMLLAAYWADPRFVAKRPGGDGPLDNFYRAMANGSIRRVANTLHDDSEAARDITGLNALVSWHFWYFGDRSPPLPNELVHLVQSGQGHALHLRRRPNDVAVLRTGWSTGRRTAAERLSMPGSPACSPRNGPKTAMVELGTSFNFSDVLQ